MAVSGEATIAQDGGHVKLHPYLVALVRWCVSCLWSTASVLLQRLLTAPRTPITGSKLKSRPAGKEHLHPEPRVECVVLHHPECHNLDVIFVHGLYGSLGNTWRQGEWRSKYVNDPEKIQLRRPTSIPSPANCCKCTDTHTDKSEFCDNSDYNNDNNRNDNEGDDFSDNTNEAFTNIDEKFYKKILPTDDVFITEQFYNNTLLNQVEIVGNYDTQAKFVSDLFKQNCDSDCDDNNENDERNMFHGDENKQFNDDQNIFSNAENIYNDNKNMKNFGDNICKCSSDAKNAIQVNERCKCKVDEGGKCKVNEGCKCKVNQEKQCEAGCGCICDGCYSPCWPRDWIKEDYPDARVISINYTSDPHLWRPIWIKENKRLRLHERADQMILQLLTLGVGERPVIWVGHSKGGLFIKQIYCEAYEAYLQTKDQDQDNNTVEQSMTEFNNDNEINNNNEVTYNDSVTENINVSEQNKNYVVQDRKDVGMNICNTNDNKENGDNENNNVIYEVRNESDFLFNAGNNISDIENSNKDNENTIIDGATIEEHMNNSAATNDTVNENGASAREKNVILNSKDLEEKIIMSDREERSGEPKSSNIYEDAHALRSRVGLWSNSVGFMFYSVPHRGSPLADIKAPLTARSIELLEITKDCSLVLSLQERWLRACGAARPLVRSLVETKRTLMSVLWLRIVSADSADPGIGALCGVSVDHREICKPTSRRCQLYGELAAVIGAARGRCRCHGDAMLPYHNQQR